MINNFPFKVFIHCLKKIYPCVLVMYCTIHFTQTNSTRKNSKMFD